MVANYDQANQEGAAGSSSRDAPPDNEGSANDEDFDNGHLDHGERWYKRVTHFLSEVPLL